MISKKIVGIFIVLTLVTSVLAINTNIAYAVKDSSNDIVDIAVGYEYYAALRSDGTVWWWDKDVDSPTPRLVDKLEGIKSIYSASYNYALKKDNTVCTWSPRESVNPNTNKTSYYYYVKDIKNLDNIKTLMQDNHIIALKNNNTVWGYSYNYFGELGTNHLGKSSQEVMQVNSLNNVHVTAVSYGVTVAMKKDGSLWLLGKHRGQFGDCLAKDIESTTPIKVNVKYKAADIKKISLNGWSSLFLKTDGTIEVCGQFYSKNYSKPTKIDIEDVVDVIHGEDFTYYLKSDGTVWIQKHSTQIPMKVPELSNISSIDHLRRDLIALSDDGDVYTWKVGEKPKVVDFPFKETKNVIKEQPTSILDISASFNNFSVLKSDGTVWGWRKSTETPTMVKDLTGVTDILSGHSNHVLRNDGTIFSWLDYPIQVPNSNEVETGYSLSVLEGLKDITAVSENFNLVALKKDGTVWGFGFNAFGELGPSNLNTQMRTPFQVEGFSDVKRVFTGTFVTLVIKNDGTVQHMGVNYGSFGNGYDNTPYTTPQSLDTIPNIDQIRDIEIGDTCSVYMYKDNTSFIVGRYGNINNETPTKFDNIRDIVLQNNYMCYVKSDGTVWIHRYDKSDKPVKIDSLSNIVKIDNYQDKIIVLGTNDVYTFNYNDLAPNKINLPFAFEPIELNYSDIVKVDMSYEDTDIPGIMQAKVMAHMKDGSVHDVTHDENIIYESQDTTIATVTDQGVIALFKEEKAHISVTFITEDGSLTFTEEGVEKRFNKSEAVLFTPYKTLTQSPQNGSNQESDATTPTIKIDGKKKKSWLQKIFGGGPKDVDYGDSYVDENGVTHYYHTIFKSCYLKYDIINVIPKNTYYRRVYKAPSMPAKALRIRAIYVLEDGTEIELPAEYTEFKTNRDTKSIKYIKNDGNPDSRIIYASNFSQGELKITTKFKFDKGEKAEKGFNTKDLNAELTLQVRPNFIDELLFYNNGLKGRYKAKSVAKFSYGADTYVRSLQGSIKGMFYKTFDLVEASSAKQIDGLLRSSNTLSDSQWHDDNQVIYIPEYAIGDSFKDINKKYSLSYMWRTGDADKSTFHVIFGIGDSVVYITKPPKSGNINVQVLKGEWVPVKK